jgi:type II secretory pathway component PulK
MSSPDVSGRSRRDGFALPAVLVVTAVVTLIFLVAMTALESLNREARAARQRVDATIRAMTAEARLTHLAATEPLGSQAIRVGAPRVVDEFATEAPANIESVRPPLRIDGRPYAIPDLAVRIEVQDMSGLTNLQRLDEAAFRRLLIMAGASSRAAEALWPVFLDYTDGDELRRAGGDETGPSGGPPPANRPLRHADELLAVPGVAEAIDPLAWRRLRPMLTADHTQPTLNINTADPLFLEVMFGMSPADAAEAIAFREERPFTSLFHLRQVTGAPITPDEELIYTFPSGRFEVRVEDQTSDWAYRSRVVLTPTHPERPFWIDQRDIAPVRAPVGRDTDVPELPHAQD